MRVIAGHLGGRTFDSPHTLKTHPMSDKARGALFNVLGDIEDLTVLDAFAGSGALAIEAVSRGASSAVVIDRDRTAQQTLTANMHALGLHKQIHVIHASANAWLQTNPDAVFDIVLCDPPYNDLQLSLVSLLAAHVKPAGLLVLSWPRSEQFPKLDKLELVEFKHYGDMGLAFYHKT